MTTANLILGLDTSVALRDLSRFKSMAEDQMKGFKVNFNLGASVKEAIKELDGLKGLKGQVIDVTVNTAGAKAALAEVFKTVYDVQINAVGLTAQVQAAINAGMVGARLAPGSVPITTRTAGPGVDMKTVTAQVGASMADAVVNGVSKAAQKISAERAGPSGSLGYSYSDKETGKRISYREPIPADLAMSQITQGNDAKRALEEARKIGPTREDMERLRNQYLDLQAKSAPRLDPRTLLGLPSLDEVRRFGRDIATQMRDGIEQKATSAPKLDPRTVLGLPSDADMSRFTAQLKAQMKDVSDQSKQTASDDVKNARYRNVAEPDEVKRLVAQVRNLEQAKDLIEKRNAQGRDGESVASRRFGSELVQELALLDEKKKRLQAIRDLNSLAKIQTDMDKAERKNQPDAWAFGPDFNTLTKLRDSYKLAKDAEADRAVSNSVKYVNPGQENQVRALEAQLKKLAEAQEYVKNGRLDLAIAKYGQEAVDDIPKIQALRTQLTQLRAEANASAAGVSAAAALRQQMQATMAAAQTAASNSGRYTSFGARAAGAAALRDKFGDDAAQSFLKNDELFAQSANLDDHRKKVAGNTEAYRAWRNAANDAHSAARGLAGSLGALWVTWGNTAPIVAAAAIGLAVRSAFMVGKDLEYQLQFVSVLAGDAAISITKFGDAVRGSMVAPVEAAQALRGLAQNGLSARESLQALPAILNLATVGEMALSEAALGATGVMAAFNLQVSDLGRVGDVFAKAAALSNTSVGGMVEAMRQASTVSDQYNVSLEETAATLATMAKRNIAGSAAGTAFRNMMVELTTPHEKAKRAMEAVGLQLYDNSNQLKDYGSVLSQLRDKIVVLNEKGRLTFLNEMFGERGAKAANALLSDFDLYQETLSKLQNESENFSANVARALQETTQGKIRALVTEFQLATSTTFMNANKDVNYFIDTLRQAAGSTEFQSMLTSVSQTVLSLTNFIVENGKQVLITVGSWMAFRAAFGLTSGIVAFTSALAAAGVAATTLRVALTGLATAATGGLALIAALAFEYFTFKNNTYESVEAQKQLNTQLNVVATSLAREANALEESNRVLARRVQLMREGKTFAQANTLLDDEEQKRKGLNLQNETTEARRKLAEAQNVVKSFDQWKVAAKADPKLISKPPATVSQYNEAKQQIEGYTNTLKLAEQQEQSFNQIRQGKAFQKQTEEEERRRREIDSFKDELSKAGSASKGRIKTADLGLDVDQALKLSKDEFDKALADQKRKFNERKGEFKPSDPKGESAAHTAAVSGVRVLLAQLNREREDLADTFARQRKIDSSLYDEKSLGAETMAIIAQNKEMAENERMRRAIEGWKAKVASALENKNLKDPDKEQLNSSLEELTRKGERLQKDNETIATVMGNNAVRKARESAQEYVALLDDLRKKSDNVATDLRRAQEKKFTSPEDFASESARLKIEEVYQSSIAEAAKRVESAQERIQELKRQGLTLNGVEKDDNQKILETAEKELKVRQDRLDVMNILRDSQGGKAGKEAVDAYRRSLTAESGFERFWNEYTRLGTDAATTVYDVMKGTTDSMGRAFEQFGASGKFSMRSLINGIISDLGRLAAQAVWKQLLGMVLKSALPGGGGGNPIYNSIGGDISAFAFATGGVMTQYGNLPLRKYDAGGVARTPQAAIFAEGRKPEAYVPLEDGRTIPVTVEGVGGGNTTSIVFSPTIHIDSRSDQAQVQMLVGRQIRDYHEQLTAVLKERGVMQ